MQCEWIIQFDFEIEGNPSPTLSSIGAKKCGLHMVYEKERKSDVPNPQMIERLTKDMAQGSSNCESNECEECHEKLSDWQESSER